MDLCAEVCEFVSTQCDDILSRDVRTQADNDNLTFGTAVMLLATEHMQMVIDREAT